MPLYAAPASVVKELKRLDPLLDCVWREDKKPERSCFAIRRQVRMPGGRRVYRSVYLVRNPVTGQRREIGHWVVAELRRMDTWAKYRSRQHFLQSELEQNYRDLASRQVDDEHNFDEELIHSAEKLETSRTSHDLGSKARPGALNPPFEIKSQSLPVRKGMDTNVHVGTD